MGTLGQLRTEDFAAKIQQYGERPAFWYQYRGECPNPVHADAYGSALARPGNACILCGGSGEIYGAQPLPNGDTGGRLLANVLNHRRAKAAVELQAGDMLVGFLEDEYPFGEGDRIGLLSRFGDHAESLVRGTGDGDRLTLQPAISVIAVYVGTSELTAANYALSSDGKQLLFGGTSGPPAPTVLVAPGTRYTIRYRYRPVYAILQGSFVRTPPADNGDLFPTTCVVRQYHLSPTDRKVGAV